MNLNNILSILIIFVPILLVTLPTIFIDTKNYGKKISFRPPPIVFSIVWPILLLLLGISWYLIYNSYNNHINNIFLLFLVLTILLASWTIIFKYSKVFGLVNIILSIIITLYLILKIYNDNKISSLLLVPLIFWLIFASVLNYKSL